MKELTDLIPLLTGTLVALAGAVTAAHLGARALAYATSRGRHRNTGSNTTASVGGRK